MAGTKLGTVLVREGVITPQQLDEALRIQVLYGGRLGTNLVDLGYVDADRMADWLGRVSGFPVATEEMCAQVPDDVLALLTPDMAERFECFPLRKDGRRLHLAMVNPGDLAATDALSFKTGLRIVPYVVPELRLYGHLERRYGVERKLRYIRLSGREDGKGARPPSTPPASNPANSQANPPVRPGSLPGLPPLPTAPASTAMAPVKAPAPYNPFPAPVPAAPTPATSVRVTPAPASATAATLPNVAPVSVPPVSRPPAATRPEVRPVSQPPPAMPPVPPSRFGSTPPPVPGLRPPASPQAMTAPSVPKVAAPTPITTPRLDVGLPPGGLASTPPPTSALALPEAIAALAEAPSRDDVADVVLRYALGQLDTAMLFLVRDGMALGWKGRGRVDGGSAEALMLPLNAPSMFQEATETKGPHAGPVADAVLHRHFYKALRREPPQSVVVVPVLMRDRVVNLIYGDRLERQDAAAASAGLSELARHIGAAYERILRDSKKRLS